MRSAPHLRTDGRSGIIAEHEREGVGMGVAFGNVCVCVVHARRCSVFAGQAVSRRRCIALLAGTVAVLQASCGGGGGSDGPSAPPVSNTPASVRLSLAGPVTLTSGSSSVVTAQVFTSDGRQLTNAAVTWASTDAAIARVQDGNITALKVGTATITATAGSVASSGLAVTVTPGAPAQVAVTIQPAGAAVAQTFAIQPVVEIQDGNGNLVPSSTLPITVTLASGGGVLSGTTTVTAAAGVAKYTDLSLSGAVGPRTLSFVATGLSTGTSSSFVLAPGAPAQLLITRQPVGGAVSAPLLTQPVVELRDVAGNLATTASTPVTASVTFGGGTVGGTSSVVPISGVARFTDLSISGPVGDRELTFSVAGAPAVTSTRFPLALIVYGLTNQKIQIVDVGASITPVSSAGTPPTFVSRAGTLASVDNAGKITARQDGEAWVVSSLPGGGDSVLTIIPRAAGGPLLRTNLTGYAVQRGSTVTVDLVLDPRSTPVGSVSLFVTAAYDTTEFAGVIALVPSPGANISINQPTTRVVRVSIASATGITTPITFARLQFIAGAPGDVLTLNLTAIDAYAPDGSDLRSGMTSTYYPLVPR